MSVKDLQLGGLNSTYVGPVTVSGANASRESQAPLAIPGAFIQSQKLSDWISVAEVWRPLGTQKQTTTSETVTAPTFTLRKNLTAPTSGGLTAATAVRAAPFAEWLPFPAYVFAAADLAGDKWSIIVTVTATAGVDEFQLSYANIVISGVNEGILTL